MDPITAGIAIGAGTSLLGGIMNNSAAQKQQRDYEAAMRKLQRMIDSDWQVPDAEKFTPEEYQVLSSYQPDIAQYIQESAPQLLNEATSQDLIAKQRQNLERMDSIISQGGEDAISRAENAQLAMEADARRRSDRSNLLSQYARRGLAGSADEMLMDAASADATNSAQYLGSLQNSAEAQRRRADMLGQYSANLNSMRGQNLNVEQNNANTTNAFNERMTRNLNQYNRYVADQKNQGQLYNKQNQQSIANMNVGLRNDASLENYRRKLNQANMNNQKLMVQAGMRQNAADMGGRFAQGQMDRTTGMLQGVGGALSQGLMLYGAGQRNQQPKSSMNDYANDSNYQWYSPGYGMR